MLAEFNDSVETLNVGDKVSPEVNIYSPSDELVTPTKNKVIVHKESIIMKEGTG